MGLNRLARQIQCEGLMSEDLREAVIEALKGQDGIAALLLAKKLGRQLMEVLRILEELSAQGIVEKRGKTYRLKAINLEVSKGTR